MLALYVVEGHNKIRVATVRKQGIRYRGKLHLPTSMDRLDGGATDPAGSLGGGAVGALAFGAAGAIVGSIAGRSGRTAVLIKTTDEKQLVCTVASYDFPALYVEIQRLIDLSATKDAMPETSKAKAKVKVAKPSWIKGRHIFFGPFYYVRFGFGWFAAAVVLTVATWGLAWVSMVIPAFAAYLDHRKARKMSSSIHTRQGLTGPSGEFVGTEGDLLPSHEG